MFGKPAASGRAALAAVLRRMQSTVATVGANAATAPVRRKVYSSAEQARWGKDAVPAWSRFNLRDKGATEFTLSDAVHFQPLALVSDKMKERTVIITRGDKSAMTSGLGQTKYWRVQLDHTPSWGNPLMGWLSSCDTIAPVTSTLKFERMEQAIFWAVRHGYKYEVAHGSKYFQKPGMVETSYADNFLSKEIALKMKALGPRRSRFIFENPHSGKPAWVNWRRTPFGPDPWRPASYQTDSAWTGPEWPAPKPVHYE